MFELFELMDSVRKMENFKKCENFGYKQSCEDGVFKLEVDVPGLSKDDLEMEYKLFSRGEYELSIKSKKDSKREFEKRFFLSQSLDMKALKAKVENGVLTLETTLKDEFQKRKIEIN